MMTLTEIERLSERLDEIEDTITTIVSTQLEIACRLMAHMNEHHDSKK